MGRIADLRAKNKAAFPGQDAGRSLWREVFKPTLKEERGRMFPPVRGGSYGRSIVNSDPAQKRLIQAFRSMAPGGWSDDRWEQTKHFNGVQHICIHRMGEQLAQAEFQVFRKDPNHQDGKRPVTPDDPPEGDRLKRPYDLVELLEHPNRDDAFGDMMYRINQQMGLTGTALDWMVPDVLGTPMELYVIPTAVAIPQPAINPDFPDGYYRIQPLYPYGPFSSYPTPTTSVGAPIPAQWIMRMCYPHPLLRYDGYSPMTAMRNHIDEVEAITRSRWYKMKRGSNPDAVLNFEDMEGMQPLTEPEIERIHAEWENEFQGPENHGKLIVGTPGAKLEEWGKAPKDMDYIQSFDQLNAFIMAGFGITKPAAGMIEDSSYSTLFATLKQLHLLTLEPLCRRIAARFTRTLGPFFGDDLIVEIRCPRIDDHEVKNGRLSLAMQGGAITKGELRRELDLPLWGDSRDDELAGAGSEGDKPGLAGTPMPGTVEPKKAEGPVQRDGELAKPAEEAKPAEGADVAAERNRPKPGKLGIGALGPRKSLIRRKSLYDQVREAIVANGRHS